MAVGIRPNTALAESMRIHCNKGIVVNDTMQTVTDARIYSVGECAAHRGIAYGLVAPLFEQAKVAANHLAQFGIGRYNGSLTSTKLKVTGIDLFSAGEFMGSEGSEEIVMSDPFGGVYKKLVIKDDKLVGACLYGDTVDGSWYFKMLRDGRSIADIRDKLMFGESNIGDAGHEGHSKAAAMPDSAEVCGCNGVNKGTICKAIKEKGLFTLDEVRKHTKASASCGSCTGLVEQILMFTAGGDYSATPKLKAMCGCTDHGHQAVRDAIRTDKLLTIGGVFKALDWKTPNGCATCRPAATRSRFPVNVVPASPPVRALQFRRQLLYALMLVVGVITGVGLVLAERNLATDVARDLESSFDAELSALRRVQELRHAALVERCRALVR
eukprot:gene45122-55196_t